MKLIMKAILLIFLVFYVTGCESVNKLQNPAGTSAGSLTSQTRQASQAQTPQTSQTAQDQFKTPPAQNSQTVLEPTPTPSLTCQWIGVDQDIVTPNEMKADGKPDGHFHLALPFNQPSALKSIMIRYSQFGKSFKWSWIYNQNLPVQGYVMGVLDNGGKIILPQGDNGYPVEGLMDFELYLSELENVNGRDTFKFAANQPFDLQINYVTDKNQEKELRYTVRIEETSETDETGEGDQTVTQ